ncbi:MAG TPA: ABC transporter permease [Propionibacteriaceae bacterium]|nr:ABC transporter permease [Propionibacteriaceae bacterium]
MNATVDFTPAPSAAAPARRVLRHARTELHLLVRNGEQLLLALAIPLLVLTVGGIAGGRWGDLSVLAPSVLALAIWSSSFTSVAISTGFERRYGVLERLVATPLRKSGLLAGKALGIVAIVIFQLLVITAAGLYVGWRPAFSASSGAVAVLLVVLAVATFVSWALALGGRLRAELTLGLANLVYVLLLVGGGLVIPVDRYPDAFEPIVQALPTGALGEGLRAAASGVVLGWPILVLLGWLAAGVLVARKAFRWI